MYEPIGRISDFPEGRGVEVRVRARRIVVFRIGGEFCALKNICPHEGDALDRLPPRDGVVTCAGHGWQFELETGRCLKGGAGARVAIYPVKVEGDTVWLDVVGPPGSSEGEG